MRATGPSGPSSRCAWRTDGHLDRAVLARRPAPQPAFRNAPGSTSRRRGLRRPGGKKLDSHEGALLTEVINRNASAHFVGGIPIGESSESGAVDPYLRLFGQPACMSWMAA